MVVGVYFGGTARAYPLWVLGSREIVNDRFGNDAVSVTYCPLSASAVVFLSRVGSRSLTFGNEGALYECNLVLYDRQTYSLRYQLRGSAITGTFQEIAPKRSLAIKLPLLLVEDNQQSAAHRNRSRNRGVTHPTMRLDKPSSKKSLLRTA